MIQEPTDIGIENESMEAIVIHDQLPLPSSTTVLSSVVPAIPITELNEEWDSHSSMGFTPLLEISTNSKEEYLLDVELAVIRPRTVSYSRDKKTRKFSIPNYDPIDLEKVTIYLEPGAYFVTEDFPGIQKERGGLNHPLLVDKELFFIIKEEIPESNRTRIKQLKPNGNMVRFLDWIYEDSENEQIHPGAKIAEYWYS